MAHDTVGDNTQASMPSQAADPRRGKGKGAGVAGWLRCSGPGGLGGASSTLACGIVWFCPSWEMLHSGWQRTAQWVLRLCCTQADKSVRNVMTPSTGAACSCS